MKINKDSAVANIRKSTKVEATFISKDATPADRDRTIKETIKSLEALARTKGNLTITVSVT
jgi:hypothetical protein